MGVMVKNKVACFFMDHGVYRIVLYHITMTEIPFLNAWTSVTQNSDLARV